MLRPDLVVLPSSSRSTQYCTAGYAGSNPLEFTPLAPVVTELLVATELTATSFVKVTLNTGSIRSYYRSVVYYYL